MTNYRSSAGTKNWPAKFDPNHDDYPGGFFAAFNVNSQGNLSLGGDRWGMYPLYYTKMEDGAILIASSPSFMHAEKTYSEEFDLAGVCGLLLVNGLINNRSLFKNVYRVPAGRIFFADNKGIISFSPEPLLPAENGWPDMNREAAVERFGSIWPEVLKRLNTGEKSLNFLSGGIDSRMITGGLGRIGADTTAYTMGKRGDYECIAAKAVAKATGTPWIGGLGDSPKQSTLAQTRWIARWSGLSGGFSSGAQWGVRAPKLQNTIYSWTGIGLDDFLGGKASGFLRQAGPEGAANHMLERLNSWGIKPDLLARLLSKLDLSQLPRELCNEFIRNYPTEGIPATTAAIKVKLEHRMRYHLGHLMWMNSFQFWPVIPALEPEIMEAGFHLSPEIIADRSFQCLFLQQYYPKLQNIPIARNSHDFRSLNNSARFRLQLTRWSEPRRYYRIFNPNNPSWRLIRRETENYRERIHDLFTPSVLAECWPSSNKKWKFDEPFGGTAGGKNLIALAWRYSTPSFLPDTSPL